MVAHFIVLVDVSPIIAGILSAFATWVRHHCKFPRFTHRIFAPWAVRGDFHIEMKSLKLHNHPLVMTVTGFSSVDSVVVLRSFLITVLFLIDVSNPLTGGSAGLCNLYFYGSH